MLHMKAARASATIYTLFYYKELFYKMEDHTENIECTHAILFHAERGHIGYISEKSHHQH